MKFTLHIWRQKSQREPGRMAVYQAEDITPEMSFLEMLDVVNESLIEKGEEPIAFDHDCREGICGTCSLVINGIPHGREQQTTACQLHMRHFRDGEAIWIEPFRARAFPVIRDLVVDRRSMDRVMQAGGYVSVNTGSAADANANLIPKVDADVAFEAAACIGCGACVAACPNAAAMLFASAKAAQLAHLPQGQPERHQRAISLVEAMDREGFGNCSNHYECEVVCPKGIKVEFIADLNRDYLRATLTGREFRELSPRSEYEE